MIRRPPKSTLFYTTLFRSGFNPYKIGYELFRDIEDRWNRGAFGPAYDNCQDREQKEKWDLKLGAGKQKIFDVRRSEEHTSELQSQSNLVCRLLLQKKKYMT